MAKNHKPIRMCIICKNRFEQSLLNRFIYRDDKLISWTQNHRSVYICAVCIQKDEKILQKSLFRLKKKGVKCL